MPTPIIQSDVVAFAAPLNTKLSAGAWTDILAYVNGFDMGGQLGASDEDVRMARIWLAAHLGTVAPQASSGAAGPVTSESAGALRRSYGIYALASSMVGLGLTQYGQQYLSILQMSVCNGPMLI